nr:uncharacterized protein LOC109191529 [Ipomoea batatas]
MDVHRQWPHIFHHLVDVDQIKQLNWCDYVLWSLMQSQLTWGFYVDRVVLYTRNIPRKIRSLIGWTSQLIKDREVAEIQAGGFGRVDREVAKIPSPARDDEPSIQPQVPLGTQSLFEEDYEAHVYVANYVELHLLGKIIVEVIELASKSTTVVCDNEVTKLMHTVAQKLLIGARVTVESSIQKDVEASSSQDSFWFNPNNIAAMDEAILKRE